MVIDAHQHVWQIGRNGHDWPTPDLTAIHRDFALADLGAEAEGVQGSVLVQSQPNDTDTNWLLAVARESSFVKGVVGWADLAAPDAPARLAELAQQPKLKGIRPMLQGITDDEWILRAEVQPAVKTLVDLDLRFDALVFPRHLKAVDRLAQIYPTLRIVIDHCAKPVIGQDYEKVRDEAWRDGISRVAANANLMCKLSGLATEMTEGAELDAIRPYADHVLKVFGPDRLMWGSDWPVLNLRTHYASWLGWTRSWLDGQTDVVRKAVLGGTACNFYQLM